MVRIILILLLFASCDPCKRLSKPKYRGCFTHITDTLTVVDSFRYLDTIKVPEIKKELLIQTDTVIETERVLYRRAGDTTVIVCKADTIYKDKVVNRTVEVPVTKYVYNEPPKQRLWLWLLIGVAVLMLVLLKK